MKLSTVFRRAQDLLGHPWHREQGGPGSQFVCHVVNNVVGYPSCDFAALPRVTATEAGAHVRVLERLDFDQQYLARLMFLDLMAQVLKEEEWQYRLQLQMFNELMAMAFPEEIHR